MIFLSLQIWAKKIRNQIEIDYLSFCEVRDGCVKVC